MFGLFFLVVVPLVIFGYFRIIIKAASKSTFFGKTVLYLIAFGLPVTYPFLYLFSSSYTEFKSLCSSSERIKIFKSIEVDIFYAPYFGTGYEALLGQPYSAFVYKSKAYTPNKNFRTEQCKKYCENWLTTECDQNQCLIEYEISENDIYIDYESKHESKDSTGYLNSSLRTQTKQLVSKEHGILAEAYNYTFYQYGTGWATILGAASGSAPSIRCEKFATFNYHLITPPKKQP